MHASRGGAAPGRRLGIIVNPLAGLGGSVALHGSDGLAAEAVARGALPRATARTAEALRVLRRDGSAIELLCPAGEMGGDAASAAGFPATIVGQAAAQPSSPADTRQAARELLGHGIDLLLFAGGDGTACDLVDAVGTRVPVLGVPAGVKMQSGVFATTPGAAGRLAGDFLAGHRGVVPLGDADIMDLDEVARRRGEIAARLYGVLRCPEHRRLRQNPKAGASLTAPELIAALAASVAQSMSRDILYFLGPGTTMLAIKRALGIEGTLLGVDALHHGRSIGFDLAEREILALIDGGGPARLMVSPLGGQGFVFGRGNQQLSAAVLRRLGRDHIVLVSTLAKLLALKGAGLLVDTGDADLDLELAGWHRIIVGANRTTVYRIAA